jgi:hypothetical protein
MAGFFSLPLELREEIYALVFTTHHTCITTHYLCTEKRFKMHIGENGIPDQPPPELMLTCKRLYCEAESQFIMSLKFVVADEAGLEAMQQWLGRKSSNRTAKNIRTIAFTSLKTFRTEHPDERRMRWDKQKGMPWRPLSQGTQTYITGSIDPSSGEKIVPTCIQLLQTLPGLQHVEIGITPLIEGLNSAWSNRHFYYDLDSLTTLSTLISVKVNLRLGGVLWRLYRSYLRKGDIELRRDHCRVKAALDDGFGLRSWLEGRFRETGSLVDVRCFCYGKRMESNKKKVKDATRTAEDL